MFSSASRIVLVTGGSCGLGEACVRRLVIAGHRVVLADNDLDRANQVADSLKKEVGAASHGTHRAHLVAKWCDVTDADSVGAVLDDAETAFGAPVQAAISCATIGAVRLAVSPRRNNNGNGNSHDQKVLEDFNEVMSVNLLGTFNVNRLAAKRMLRSHPYLDSGERGVLVNTASIAAFDGQAGQAAYAASKAGVAGLTLPFAREMAQHGIRVAAVAPGLFDTSQVRLLPERTRLNLAKSVPFPKRLGEPARFAELVEHILNNDMINGEVIRLDGSLRLPYP